MALKKLFKTIKQDGYILKPLDMYLTKLNQEGNDRAVNVNAPSQCGKCMRAVYYSRKKYEKDPNSIDPRSRRILDNGTYTHERLQDYLMKAKLLLMEEIPLRNDHYNIQGHSDGLIPLTLVEAGILEIKTINTNAFGKLSEPKEEHKLQGSVYIFCAEERRKLIRKTYTTKGDFDNALEERKEYYASLYEHIQGGNKYTKEEKIAKKVEDHVLADSLLYNITVPITKVVFIYEDKNTQEIKEFVYSLEKEKMDGILDYYEAIEHHIKDSILPEREGTSKSCMCCKWCDYKIECWC